MKLMIEGLDRLGKDTLINGIQHKLGYHQVLHFSKPELLEYYTNQYESGDPAETKREALNAYQYDSFASMFQFFSSPHNGYLIANRAHLGECVYAPLYRGYSGDYVFEIENLYLTRVRPETRRQALAQTRLVLLTEDFDVSMELVDDGESFDFTKRREEQELFIAAFERSKMPDKRIVCVSDQALGGFKLRQNILAEVLE